MTVVLLDVVLNVAVSAEPGTGVAFQLPVVAHKASVAPDHVAFAACVERITITPWVAAMTASKTRARVHGRLVLHCTMAAT